MKMEQIVVNCMYWYVQPTQGKMPAQRMLVRVAQKTEQRVWLVEEPESESTTPLDDMQTRRLNRFLAMPKTLRPLPVATLVVLQNQGRIEPRVLVQELVHRINRLVADVGNLSAEIALRVRLEVEV